MKKLLGCILAAVMLVSVSMPTQAYMYDWYRWQDWFDYDGAYTPTRKTQYRFMADGSQLVFAKEIEDDFHTAFPSIVFAGSDVYLPIAALEPGTGDDDDGGETKESLEEQIATDKQIKNDNVSISYKVMQGGEGVVDDVTLVSAKKEKLKELPAGMYAKIELADDHISLARVRVAVRLVLSVNGISYQETAVTFRCELQNRVEMIARNSVYGALMPTQFHTTYYSGEVTLDFGDKVRYTSKVAPRSRYYLNLSRLQYEELKAMYPDGYMECYSFLGGHDKFEAVGTLQIPINLSKFKEKKTNAEVYIYTVQGKTLTALDLTGASYDRATETVSIRTNQLHNYILSSRPLLKDVTDDQFNILRSGYAEDPADAEPDKA